MARFSERLGANPIRQVLQLEEMDTDLRNGLWNCFHLHYIATEPFTTVITSYSPHIKLYHALWFSLYKVPLDTLDSNIQGAQQQVRRRFFEAPWFDAYDFIEFVAQVGSDHNFVASANFVLEREQSGYRIVSNQLVPITNPTELAAIEEATKAATSSGLSPVQEHLSSALRLLGDRKLPDYRNSIKESISAVEAVAKLLAGREKSDLATALKALEPSLSLHGALRAGFLSLYGYTSDSGGIRHALLDAKEVDFADAKYMLIACSGFVTYLVAKASAKGFALPST